MRIPDNILGCVGSILQDSTVSKCGGTGFLVGIKSLRHNDCYVYLVTSRQMAENVVRGSSLGRNLKPEPDARLKLGDRWWYHPTSPKSVDVAVTMFAPALVANSSVQFISEDDFATDESIRDCGIGPGDEISVVGLFTRFSGSTTHVPIVRTGSIAMMPRGTLSIMRFGEMEVYLAECRSVGGLNGCPIFVSGAAHNRAPGPKTNTPMHPSGPGKLHFLGLMHGHWELPVDFRATPRAEAVNLGISIIVPAKKILEVLYHPELVQMREEFDQRRLKRVPMYPAQSQRPLLVEAINDDRPVATLQGGGSMVL